MTTLTIAVAAGRARAAGRTGLATAGFAILVAFVLASAGAPASAAPPPIGHPAPDFTLPRADGQGTLALRDLLAKSKAVVVVFHATRCPVARGYDGRLASLGKEYGPQGISFVAINSNKTEPAAEAAEDAKKNGFTFPVVKDDGNKVADLFDAQKTPEVYVLGPRGVLLYHGRIDENLEEPDKVKSPDLRNTLDAILAGKPVPKPETKAFGCTIKRV